MLPWYHGAMVPWYHGTSPNFNGRVGWDSKLKTVPGGAADFIPIEDSECNSNKTQNTLACFQCPSCNASQLSSNRAFQLKDLDVQCKCKTCKSKSKVKDCLCSCQRKWHICRTHQSYANDCKHRSVHGGRSSAPKRTLGPFTQDQLQKIDAKRMRRAPPGCFPQRQIC